MTVANRLRPQLNALDHQIQHRVLIVPPGLRMSLLEGLRLFLPLMQVLQQVVLHVPNYRMIEMFLDHQYPSKKGLVARPLCRRD